MTASSGPGASDCRSSMTRSSSGPSCGQVGARPVGTLVADPTVAVEDQHDGVKPGSVGRGGGLLVEGDPCKQEADVEEQVGHLGRSQHAALVYALQALVDHGQRLCNRLALQRVAPHLPPIPAPGALL